MKLKSWLKELPYTLLQGSLETEVDEVVYDSRKAAPGTVFVCMRGANVDSHTFIPDVVEKGAPVLVVEHPVEAPENVTVIQVENGRNALSLLSAERIYSPVTKKSFTSPPPKLSFPVRRSNSRESASILTASPAPVRTPRSICLPGSGKPSAVPKKIRIPAI